MRRLFVLCLSVFLLPLWSGSLFAQATGIIDGRVVDAGRGVIPGATVVVTAAATNVSRTTTTNEDGIYSFAALPDITFFFKAHLEVSLHRILEGRPELKYFEAGMDLRLSSDPYESFRIFQGRILEQYLAMSTEFSFVVIDANGQIEAQQSILRRMIETKLNLAAFVPAHTAAPSKTDQKT